MVFSGVNKNLSYLLHLFFSSFLYFFWSKVIGTWVHELNTLNTVCFNDVPFWVMVRHEIICPVLKWLFSFFPSAHVLRSLCIVLALLFVLHYICHLMLFCSKRQYWCPDENVFLKWLCDCRRTLFLTGKMSVSIVQGPIK